MKKKSLKSTEGNNNRNWRMTSDDGNGSNQLNFTLVSKHKVYHPKDKTQYIHKMNYDERKRPYTKLYIFTNDTKSDLLR